MTRLLNEIMASKGVARRDLWPEPVSHVWQITKLLNAGKWDGACKLLLINI